MHIFVIFKGHPVFKEISMSAMSDLAIDVENFLRDNDEAGAIQFLRNQGVSMGQAVSWVDSVKEHMFDPDERDRNELGDWYE